jgi:hypothetical protein
MRSFCGAILPEHKISLFNRKSYNDHIGSANDAAV